LDIGEQQIKGILRELTFNLDKLNTDMNLPLPARASVALQSLANKGTLRTYAANTLVLTEGETSDTLYIVVQGKVRVYVSGDQGREITLSEYVAGEFFGEMSLDGGPRSASATTVTDTVLAAISKPLLTEHLKAHPEFAFEIINKLIHLVRVTTTSTRNLATLDNYGRLRIALETLKQTNALGQHYIPKTITQSDLAMRMGCSREMVSRLSRELERGGYIAREKFGIHLIKPLPNQF
jgi:CRP/FNR family transcriptional regulator, cyclic AMP receptor protein